MESVRNQRARHLRNRYFWEVTYRIGQKNLHMITSIYDVAGELIRDSAGTGRTGFVRHMDGFICLVDPAQMHLGTFSY